MQPTSSRHEFLDWLRVIAVFLLLFYHTGMLFVGWGWHLTNAETLPVLQLPMAFLHRLRMPLLFVVAGAGLWFAAKRRSRGALLRERTLRLLLPAAAGMLLVVPPQIYVERVARGQWRGSYLDFVLQRVLQFQPYPAGNFSWHHLWFIVYLYVYVLLLLPLLPWWRLAHAGLRPGAWLYALALPLGFNEALLEPLFPGSHNLTSDWYLFVHYLLLTVYGVALASLPGAWDWLAQQRRRSLALALALTGGLLLFQAWPAARGAGAALLANLFTWVWLLTLLGYGRQALCFDNHLLSWARDASYPIYILHQTVILVLAHFVVRQPWSPWAKYWLVLGATWLVCVALYELVLRRFSLLRLLFGIKLRGAPQHAPAAEPWLSH